MGFGMSQAQIRTIVQEEVEDIKEQTDKLAGETPSKGNPIGDWEDGIAASGETGDNLVSIGTAGTRNKLNSLQVDISALTDEAIITIRLYEIINVTERKVYPPSGTTWKKGTDPDGIWVVDGPVEITGVLRVEVQSDNANDTNDAIGYEYALEAM